MTSSIMATPVEWAGESLLLSEWEDILELDSALLYERVRRNGNLFKNNIDFYKIYWSKSHKYYKAYGPSRVRPKKKVYLGSGATKDIIHKKVWAYYSKGEFIKCRRKFWFSWAGEELNLVDWAKILEIPYRTLQYRFARTGTLFGRFSHNMLGTCIYVGAVSGDRYNVLLPKGDKKAKGASKYKYLGRVKSRAEGEQMLFKYYRGEGG